MRIIEEGPVRRIVESVHEYGRSRLVMHVVLWADWPVVEVRFRIAWNEVKTRLKFMVPALSDTDHALCEIPGGTIRRASDGQEQVHGRWIVLPSTEGRDAPALGVVNSGQHGFDLKDGNLGLSVLRSAAYCHERGLDLAGRERRYMDQGEHELRLLVTTGSLDYLPDRLSELADYLDAPLFALAHLPSAAPLSSGKPAPSTAGSPDGSEPLIRFDTPSMRLVAMKRSADGEALILRIQNTSGRAMTGDLFLTHPSRRITTEFGPFEIVTIRVERDSAFSGASPVTDQ